MRLHYLLVSVEKPTADSVVAGQVWDGFVAKTQGIELKSKESRRLAENVWLLDVENDASALARIVHSADGFHLPHFVRLLSTD